jgi:hypothetical protein
MTKRWNSEERPSQARGGLSSPPMVTAVDAAGTALRVGLRPTLPPPPTTARGLLREAGQDVGTAGKVSARSVNVALERVL